VPVDDRGVRADALERSGAGAVLLTPAHQFPTGGVLAPERRETVIAWARAAPARFVVEDDYDAEFRYDRAPIGSLQGLDPERVIQIGSVSKTLAPALRLGWILSPVALTEPILRRKAVADLGSPVLQQLTLADLIARGILDRHLRGVRRTYQRRRDALVAALRNRLPDARVTGIAAGLHLAAELPTGIDERALVSGLLRDGVRTQGIAEHALRARRPPTLLLGYAALHEEAAPAAVERIAATVAAVPELSAARTAPA
jgi:GntR family transcriptional regulator/MocR family aminotransferase